ncbi:MAG TPA: alpha/beta hydrolase [Candidatus Babeliales bacterium]|nr:alpha/beta hydrolase [Candidatus Babeliales bacterium]
MRIYVSIALLGLSVSLFGAEGVKEEDVTFYAQREAGSKEYNARKGYIAIRPDAKATILALHGYTSSKDDANMLRLLFPDYNLMVFDFRAHGENIEGPLSTLGADEIYDVYGDVDYIKSRKDIKNLPIIGYGFSMGAATGIEAQAKNPNLFVASIYDCPFDKTENIIHRGFEKLKIKLFGYEFDFPGRSFLERHAFNPYVQTVMQFLFKKFAKMDASQINTMMKPIEPMESIKKIKTPIFFIGCVADEAVPIASVKRIYENAPGKKKFWATKGKGHFRSLFNNPEEYQKQVTEFVDSVLSGDIAQAKPAEEVLDVELPKEGDKKEDK